MRNLRKLTVAVAVLIIGCGASENFYPMYESGKGEVGGPSGPIVEPDEMVDVEVIEVAVGQVVEGTTTAQEAYDVLHKLYLLDHGNQVQHTTSCSSTSDNGLRRDWTSTSKILLEKVDASTINLKIEGSRRTMEFRYSRSDQGWTSTITVNTTTQIPKCAGKSKLSFFPYAPKVGMYTESESTGDCATSNCLMWSSDCENVEKVTFESQFERNLSEAQSKKTFDIIKTFPIENSSTLKKVTARHCETTYTPASANI